MKLCTFESSFSDYHKVVTMILRKTICNDNPKTKNHMSFSQSKIGKEMKYMNDATYRSNFFLIFKAFS